MANVAPVPKKDTKCWFYADDRIKLETEHEATILSVYMFDATANKMIYKYDDDLQEVIPNPLMDLWIEQVPDLFWILADQTDYILELYIPSVCAQNTYAARTLDGEWHTFETHLPRQFGFVDVTGEYHNKLHSEH